MSDVHGESGPGAEYSLRLARRKELLGSLTRQDQRLGNLRLVVFAVGAMIAGLAIWSETAFAWLLPLPVAAFVMLAVYHDRALHARMRAQSAVAFYAAGLDRVGDHWTAGTTGARYQDPAHPYTADLDIFGPRSLFHRLCTATTQEGQQRLAGWLATPAPPEVVLDRQAAVKELGPNLALREDLSVLGVESRPSGQPGQLSAWGASPAQVVPASVKVTSAILGALNLCAALFWATTLNRYPFYISLLISQLYALKYRALVTRIVKAVDRPARDLERLSGILARIEREEFSAPALTRIKDALRATGAPPSQHIAQLQSLFGYLEQRRNLAFRILGLVVNWTDQFAFAIESWRARYGPSLGAWVSAVAEMEALCSLASLAYENPEYVYPEICDGSTYFRADGLAHPLLARTGAIPNDVELGETRLLVVSGSNMSGKSTLLRSVGTNVVLALAGAPVRATSMRLRPLSLGTSIRTQDSLQEGVSRFYAEIRRLRQVMEIAEVSPPALFLLDEVLHGTNSHDRLIGAEAIARALVKLGAVGLLTTHDLALAQIEGDAELHARNVHFEDFIQDGKVAFDYRMRPGVVERSNALELMRAVGLDV